MTGDRIVRRLILVLLPLAGGCSWPSAYVGASLRPLSDTLQAHALFVYDDGRLMRQLPAAECATAGGCFPEPIADSAGSSYLRQSYEVIGKQLAAIESHVATLRAARRARGEPELSASGA